MVPLRVSRNPIQALAGASAATWGKELFPVPPQLLWEAIRFGDSRCWLINSPPGTGCGLFQGMKSLWGVFYHIQSSVTSLETHRRLGIWRPEMLWGQGAGMSRAGGPSRSTGGAGWGGGAAGRGGDPARFWGSEKGSGASPLLRHSQASSCPQAPLCY